MRAVMVFALLQFCLAAPTLAQGLRFATDSAAPIDIAAGLMVWQREKNVAELTGAARLEQGPLNLTAQRIVLRLGDDGTAETLTATGDVVLLSTGDDTAAPRRATAARADMDLKGEKLVLSGNVAVVEDAAGADEKRLSGGRLALDMVSGKARLTGGGDKPRARIELR